MRRQRCLSFLSDTVAFLTTNNATKKTPFFTQFKESLINNDVWKKEDPQTGEENILRKEKENIWKEKELGGALMDELSTCVSLGPSFRYIWNGSGMGGTTCGWEER